MIADKRASHSIDLDVLSILINAYDENGITMTDDELIGQTNILFIAGHETTANALTWTLFLLSQHPAEADKLSREIDETLRGGAISLEVFDDMPMLHRVIKESLRILPPVTWAQRSGNENFDVGPYHLTKNSSVLISHYLTHRMSKIYPQPNKFRPDRWLDIEPTPYEYLPFSAGPRLCLGAGFAMLEMKIVLSMIFQRFRLHVAPDARIDYDVKGALTPKRGMPMIITSHSEASTRQPVKGTIHTLVDLPHSGIS